MNQEQALNFIEEFEIICENNDSRDPTADEKNILHEFVFQLFDDAPAMNHDFIDVLFSDGPRPFAPLFVEVNSPSGESINAGKWIQRDDGLWALRICLNPSTQGVADEREAFKRAHKHLDLTEKLDAWNRPAFAHSHVDAMWSGWQAHASECGDEV